MEQGQRDPPQFECSALLCEFVGEAKKGVSIEGGRVPKPS